MALARAALATKLVNPQNLDLKWSLPLRVVAVAPVCFLVAAAMTLYGIYRELRHLPRLLPATLPSSRSTKGSTFPDWPANIWERTLTALKSVDRGICRTSSARRALAASLAVAFTVFFIQASAAAEPAPMKIAVFDFELSDKSAAGGIIAQDAVDTENLKQSTEQARTLLAASGRYSIVDTGPVAGDVTSAGGIQRCDGCDGPLSKKLGADQSMVGVVTRVSRAEYTVQIVIRDTQTRKIVSNGFSGLRMGANYSWPRGVKSLMNQLLSAQPAQ